MKETEKRSQQIKQFIKDAIADGWSIKPTYGDHEFVERAASLEKDDYKLMVMNRIKENYADQSIHGWGPDGLAITVDIEYDWEQIQDAIHICGKCHKKVSHVQRVGFAGRVCVDCLADAQEKHEYPGWTK